MRSCTCFRSAVPSCAGKALAPARPASPTFRCGHCGGQLFVDDVDIVLLRSEKLEEVEDRPRRGRPPKRPR